MKSVHWSLIQFIISGLVITTCSLILAAWAVLPGAYPYSSTMPPRFVWADTADRVIVFDGQTGKLSRAVSKDYPTAMHVLHDGSWYYFDDQASNVNQGTTVAVIDGQQRREIRRFNLGAFHPTFLTGRRYLVSWNGSELSAYDLTHDDSQPLRLKLTAGTITHGPIGMPQESRILVTASTVSGATLQIFDIEPSGIALKASFPMGVPGHVFETGNSLTVVNQAKDGLERRSLETGEVLQRFPLPTGFNLTATDMAFRKDYISTLDNRGVVRHFHVATGQELKLGLNGSIAQAIPGTTLGIYLSRDQHDQRAWLVDEATNQVRWSFKVPRSTYCSADVSPNGQVWITSSRMGLTAYLLDIESGKVVRTLQPFVWVPLSLVAICLAATAWFVSWRRFVARNHWSLWWEVYALLIWVLGLMTYRMWYLHGPTEFSRVEFSRVPAAIGYGVVLASLQVAVVWIWIGRGRIIDRLVHIVAVFILVGLSFRKLHYPSANDWPAILFLYCALPALGMLLTPLVLSRTRFFKQQRERSKCEGIREIYSLNTFLTATAWWAIFFMVYGTILPSMVRIPFADLSYDYFAASGAVAMTATLTALSSNRLVYRMAAAAAILLMLALLIYICNEAVVGIEPYYRHSTIRFRIIALGSTFSFTFWLLATAVKEEKKEN